jgi:hypothetical protein
MLFRYPLAENPAYSGCSVFPILRLISLRHSAAFSFR